ncbi:MAG TPA: hypothetical protein PLF73_11605 [Luteimonas sp.]|nr:hypothetical protein [Luteimonas sp.]
MALGRRAAARFGGVGARQPPGLAQLVLVLRQFGERVEPRHRPRIPQARLVARERDLRAARVRMARAVALAGQRLGFAQRRRAIAAERVFHLAEQAQGVADQAVALAEGGAAQGQ